MISRLVSEVLLHLFLNGWKYLQKTLPEWIGKNINNAAIKYNGSFSIVPYGESSQILILRGLSLF